MKNNLKYNKNLKENAHQLRSNMTKAEASLWKYVLKSKQLLGLQFRRQRPVMNYIADFMNKDHKIIIEVDGITHHFNETYKNDQKREGVLKNEGFHIIRISDEEVLKNLDGIRKYLENEIAKLIT